MKWANVIAESLAFVGALLMSLDYVIGEARLERLENRILVWISRRAISPQQIMRESSLRLTQNGWSWLYTISISLLVVCYIVDEVLGIGYTDLSLDAVRGVLPLGILGSLLAVVVWSVFALVMLPLVLILAFAALYFAATAFLKLFHLIVAIVLHVTRRVNAHGHVLGGIGVVAFLVSSFLKVALIVIGP
jgi:hypothetical protein